MTVTVATCCFKLNKCISTCTHTRTHRKCDGSRGSTGRKSTPKQKTDEEMKRWREGDSPWGHRLSLWWAPVIGWCRGGGPERIAGIAASSHVGAGSVSVADPTEWRPCGGFPSDLQGESSYKRKTPRSRWLTLSSTHSASTLTPLVRLERTLHLIPDQQLFGLRENSLTDCVCSYSQKLMLL